MPRQGTVKLSLPVLLLLTVFALAAPAGAAAPVALSQVPVPEPANLGLFVQDKNAAIRLGKALFWDMQVGSDGQTACATCHFHAGADSRSRNTLHPGVDGKFDNGHSRSNADLRGDDFPFVTFAVADDRTSARTVRDDRVGSQGVNKSRSLGINTGDKVELGRIVRDNEFHRNGRNVRQSTGRNAPSVINAVFNFANFWDGRANHYFNGVTPFGGMDTAARVHINTGNGLAQLDLTRQLLTNPYALDNASLASQAVGPVLSDIEMSWIGRSWPEVGRKMLTLKPLANQQVHANDSRLAPWRVANGLGLNTTYSAMIQAAFRPEFFNSPALVGGYSQMESNFSLFFGLALQLYQATLVADQTPFDRFLQGDNGAMSERAQKGWSIFQSGGAACFACHIGPELTGASVSLARAPGEAGLIELMTMGNGALANYDIGYYNIGATRTNDDLGRGGRVTLNGLSLPLSFTGQWFERATLPFNPVAQPGCINNFLANPPTICPPTADTITRQAVKGAFKTPGLRNIELTGPYMHDGSMVTLMQVVDFYTRGGNFHAENLADLDPFINTIGQLQGDEERQEELVDFLLALTDERVRQERAPFDHPQLIIPDGHEERIAGNPKRSRVLVDRMVEIPAVGANGRPAQGLPPLRPFLAPAGMSSTDFHYQP
ncbi:MAG: cytochrome C peroxidase [Deltaproteobacteria bacterium HGW-Deltaproteobacteria-4]|nr:MAG: cytochrome C peroxidase [Deltaproteobacteria bacterium HGW-Deltaproteobacteria-4]